MLAFGLSPEEVGNLTFYEFNVMMERHNEKRKENYTILRNVILNALSNSMKKRNTLIPLFEDEPEIKTKEEILEEREELFGDHA